MSMYLSTCPECGRRSFIDVEGPRISYPCGHSHAPFQAPAASRTPRSDVGQPADARAKQEKT
jgi:hypothetical protein